MAIHIVFMGLPLCGFTTTLPHEWPAKHKWVDSHNPMAINATCAACIDERAHLSAEFLRLYPELGDAWTRTTIQETHTVLNSEERRGA